jgi:hypothetical protein
MGTLWFQEAPQRICSNMTIGYCRDCKRAVPNADCDGGFCPYCEGENVSCNVNEREKED